MAVLDEDFGTDLTLVEGNGGVRSCPMSLPERAPRDLRSLYERERARADAAEARAEELRWAEVASRSDAGSWKSRFKACRRRLSEAVEETKEARRAGKGRGFLAGRSGAPWRRSSAKPASGRTRAARPRRCARRTPGCARPWSRRRPERARSARGPRRPVGGALPWSGPRTRRTPSGRYARRSPGSTTRRVRRDKQILQLNKRRRPGEGEHGEHQGGRREAVQRVPSAPSGGEDTGRQRGPGPDRCPTRSSGCAMPWRCSRPGRRS